MPLPLTVFQKLAEHRYVDVLPKLFIFLEVILQGKNVLETPIALASVSIQLVLIGAI